MTKKNLLKKKRYQRGYFVIDLKMKTIQIMEIKRPNLNKVIESLEKQINSISIEYDCNITRRRAEQLRQNLKKQDNLKDIQCQAKALNEMWGNNQVPEQLKYLSSAKDIELLSYAWNEYPTEEEIKNSSEWRKDPLTKRKLKFDKWGLNSQEKVEEARNLLNQLKLQLTEEEIKQREIKKIENNIRGVKIPGFFPTPKNLIEEMITLGCIDDSHEVLEPSAGKGDMVDVLKANGINNIDCIEINHSLKEILKLKGCNLVGDDFLEFNDKKYDRIIMNPPFEDLQDIDHIRHAYNTLKEGGILVSVMCAGMMSNSRKKAEEFREWIYSLGAVYYKNDEGAFKSAFNSTGVSSYMIKIIKQEGNRN